MKKVLLRGISLVWFFLFVMVFSCSAGSDGIVSPNDNGSVVLVPSNLALSINIVGTDSNNPFGDGSGTIQCTATATDAVKYGFRFDSGDEIESASGMLDFTFTNEGTNSHTVFVFAYSSTNNFISSFQEITVYVADNGPKLVWSDEFNIDGAPNPSNWNYNLGAGGWGNNELQTYTNNSENVFVKDGVLKIIAKSDGSGGYTSARIKTENLFEFKYGTIEVRAKLPAEQGTWPAIWMLGANFDLVGWPTCGEIDIMEQKGWDKNTVLGTCHWSNNGNYAGYGLDTAVANTSNEFHIYKLEWRESAIRLFVNNTQYFVMTTNTSMPFNANFFFILNIAMGGNLGGDINPGFTQDEMVIDYIRVYE